jgi:aspartyl aminopeptidase
MEKKSTFQAMEDKLLQKNTSAWLDLNEKDVMKFAEDYKSFLAESKTERLASRNIKQLLEKNGFKNILSLKKLKPGDKIYKHVKAKTLIAAVVGKKPEELRIIGSHVDSPRLDLKPSPLTEDANIAMLKTHYYGGIKKYQWVNHPLSLHGVVHTKNGKEVEIHLGDKPGEPKFIISDLLPHLARKQMEKDSKNVVEGEELNILVGNLPVKDEKIKQQVKLNIMSILSKEYGIIEEDFNFAELELVPSVMPMDIGFDKSLVAAYGQDDKVLCVHQSSSIT